MEKQVKNKKPASPSRAGEIIFLVVVLLLVAYQYSSIAINTANNFSGNIFVARLILTLKIISGFITVASVIGIIYVVVNTQRFMTTRPLKKILPDDDESLDIHKRFPRNVKNNWARLRKKLDSASDGDAQNMIIEADNIADKALQLLGLPGETMGERLEMLSDRGLKSLEDLWQAHKLRNEIVHQIGVEVRYSDALWAIEKYEKALKEIGVL